MDYRDTPAMNETLDDVADANGYSERFAMAAVTYEPSTERKRGRWFVMYVSRSGRVEWTEETERREARQLLQLTASMVGEEQWDSKKRRWVQKVADQPRKVRPAGLSPNTRWKVLERDGRRCQYCGQSGPEVVLHVDHVKSRKDGGTDDLTNLVTACQDCNLGKGARSA